MKVHFGSSRSRTVPYNAVAVTETEDTTSEETAEQTDAVYIEPIPVSSVTTVTVPEIEAPVATVLTLPDYEDMTLVTSTDELESEFNIDEYLPFIVGGALLLFLMAAK